LVCAGESKCEQNQIGFDDPICASLWHAPSVDELCFSDPNTRHPVAVCNKFNSACQVFALSEFLVRASHFKEIWEGGPRLVWLALCWRLVANCQSGYRECTLASCRAQTVGSSVSATENDYVLSGSAYLIVHVVTGYNLVCLMQIVHRELDALKIATRNIEITWFRSSSCHKYGVKSRSKFWPGYVYPDVYTEPEACAFGFHLSNSAVNVVLLHFEIRNSVAKQAANSVIFLEDGNGVASPG
jgi:hypothetical protein